MFAALSPNARFFAALVALLALASIVARFVYDYGSGASTVIEAVWMLARFFTLLTSGLVVLTFGAAAFRRDGVNPAWLAALTLAMVMVGAVYHLMLAHLVSFTGLGLYADHGLHTATPIACLLWWIIFAPKRQLYLADLPMFVLWPSVYVAYALARGAQDGIYPYPFMDLTELEPAAVAVNLAGLTASLLIGGIIFVLIGRFADR